MLFKKSIKHPIMFNLTSGVTDLDDKTTSINRCIGLILTTGKGELLGDPDFGCKLYELLFEQYSPALESQIKIEIVNSISKYEKRITVKNSDIDIQHIEDGERNKYHISITYDISGTSSQGNTTFTLEEGAFTNG